MMELEPSPLNIIHIWSFCKFLLESDYVTAPFVNLAEEITRTAT